jgi:hypothetical protein
MSLARSTLPDATERVKRDCRSLREKQFGGAQFKRFGHASSPTERHDVQVIPMATEHDPEQGQAGVLNERDPRLCTFVKPDGSLCKGWKAKGTALCAGHLGLGMAADPAAYSKEAAHRSAEVRQEAAQVRKRRAVDVYREAAEQHAEEFVRVRVAIVRDRRASAGDRLKAMEQLEARALGRPTERIETETVRSEAQQELDNMTPEQRIALLRRMNAAS